MAHKPLKMTIEEAHEEVKYGWAHAYSPEALAQAVDSLDDQPLGYRVNIFLARLCFRGIYFPMMGRLAWVKVIAQIGEPSSAWCGNRCGDTGPAVEILTPQTFLPMRWCYPSPPRLPLQNSKVRDIPC
jgi:hypothetical protein